MANTRHGTHSPFVYKLADEVIYDFSAEKVCVGLEELRKKLLNDHKGRLKDDQNEVEIKKSKNLLQLIYRLVTHHQPQHIIEIGAIWGLTTVCLAKASPKAQLLSLTASPENTSQMRHTLKIGGVEQVQIETGDPQIMAQTYIHQAASLDLVYVNGKNTKALMLHIFNQCLAKVHEGSLLVFEELYANEDTKSAWETIKMNPQVTVTIDLFWIGLVYFRKGQAKENFKLRF